MFKTLTRSSAPPVRRGHANFAETQFLHDAEDADYSGFAPTELFDDAATPEGDARTAAATSHSALARAAAAPARADAQDLARPLRWSSSQWGSTPDPRTRRAADAARTVIAAQRRGDAGATGGAAVAGDRGGVGRLLRGLLPLFIGVTVTMALISAVLPWLDKL